MKGKKRERKKEKKEPPYLYTKPEEKPKLNTSFLYIFL
jgi:hypothetical protein